VLSLVNVELVSRIGGLGVRSTCVSGSEMTGGDRYWEDQEVQVNHWRGFGVWRSDVNHLSTCMSVQEAHRGTEDPGQLLHGYEKSLKGSVVCIGLSISCWSEAEVSGTLMSHCQQLGSRVATG